MQSQFDQIGEREKKINGWWIESNPYAKSQEDALKRQKKLRNAFRVYLCSVCLNVWQSAHTGDFSEISYYKDFPTYKLKRRECDKCRG